MPRIEFERRCEAPNCSKSFMTSNVRKRYCDDACRSAAHHAKVAADAVNVRVRAAREALRRLAEAAHEAGPKAWNDAWDQVDAEIDDITRTFREDQ